MTSGLIWVASALSQHLKLAPATRSENRPSGRARARATLAATFEALSGGPVHVSPPEKIGEGAWRNVFRAQVTTADGRDLGLWAVLVPRPDTDPEQDAVCLSEAHLLEALGQAPLPFSVPQVVGIYRESERLSQIRQFVIGRPVSYLRSETPPVWDRIGAIAAAIHALSASQLPADLGGGRFRHDHTEEAFNWYPTVDHPVLDDAVRYLRTHQPTDGPSTFIHGDLLGQNILLDGDRTTVIDWEYSRFGDPAYELALVTRGEANPFGHSDGRRRLVDAYRTHGGTGVEEADVAWYELSLAVKWAQESIAAALPADRIEEDVARARRLMQVCTSAQPNIES